MSCTTPAEDFTLRVYLPLYLTPSGMSFWLTTSLYSPSDGKVVEISRGRASVMDSIVLFPF